MTDADAATTSTYQLVGRVLPERYPVGLEEVIDVSLEWRYGPFSVQFQIRDGQFWASLTTEGAPDPLEVRNLCRDVAEAFVDALGYELEAALTVDLYGVTTPEGEFIAYNTIFGGLKDDAGFSAERASFLADVGMGDPQVASALANLRRGIAHPGDTSLYSYRAVEAIRQRYLTGDDTGAARKKSWLSLKAATRGSEAELDWLTERSTPSRHGVGAAESSEDRKRALKVARAVVDGHMNKLYLEGLAIKRSANSEPSAERGKSDLGAQRGMQLRHTFLEPGEFVAPKDVTEVLNRARAAESGSADVPAPEVTEDIVEVTPGHTIQVDPGKGGATPFGGRAPDGWIEIWW